MAGVYFRWRERIHKISPWLEDELDSLYAGLQTVWAQISTLSVGGTGSDLSTTGPGYLKQISSGAPVTVGALLTPDLGSGAADSTTFLRGDRIWSAPPTSLLWFVASLGGSRQQGVRHSTWTPAPEYAEVVLDSVKAGSTVVVRVEVKTQDGSTSVTPRLRNVTDGTTAGTGTSSTSTTWQAQSFNATLATGEKRYRLELLPGTSNYQVYGIGTVEPFTGIWGGSFPETIINVRDYGAVGDGTTDDASAIQSAITAGAGNIVFFPPGTYRVNSQLTVSSQQTRLVGCQAFGTGTGTWLKGDVTGGTLLSIDANHCSVEHLLFISYNVVSPCAVLLDVSNNNGLTVRDCSFLYASAEAILATNCYWSRFERLLFQPHGGIAIKAVNSFNANTIDQCKFLYSAGENWTAIELASGASATCTGNVIRGCSIDGGDSGGTAIKLYDKVFNLLIEGCRAETNGLNGVWCDDQCESVTLVSNQWAGASGSKANPCLYIDGGFWTIIGDNFEAATVGIEATANCRGLTLINPRYGSEVVTAKSLSSHLTTPGYSTNGYFTEIQRGRITYGPGCGTFTAAAASTTVVSDTRITAASVIFLQPTNAAAATLMSGSKSLYISARTANTSFTVATADATASAGTETFNYWFVM